MTVVQLFFTPEFRTHPAHLFELVEVDHEDFEQFLIAVDEGRLICGSQLITMRDPDDRNGRIVVRRAPLAFKGAAVQRAQLPTYRLVEAD